MAEPAGPVALLVVTPHRAVRAKKEKKKGAEQYKRTRDRPNIDGGRCPEKIYQTVKSGGERNK